ncbi:MAG: hypothetical protein WC620_07955 [Methanoregula sp.]
MTNRASGKPVAVSVPSVCIVNSVTCPETGESDSGRTMEPVSGMILWFDEPIHGVSHFRDWI